MTRPVNISRILSGPHIKRMIDQAGSPALIEIEPLQFYRVRQSLVGERARISSRPIR
jgi:hypothetical protein